MLAKGQLEIERTKNGFNISGLGYTTEEAMYIADWIVTKLQDENMTQEDACTACEFTQNGGAK